MVKHPTQIYIPSTYYVGKRQTKKEIYGLASHCIDNPLAQLLAQIICSKPIIYIVYLLEQEHILLHMS